jgi:hypothetical protein
MKKINTKNWEKYCSHCLHKFKKTDNVSYFKFAGIFRVICENCFSELKEWFRISNQ